MSKAQDAVKQATKLLAIQSAKVNAPVRVAVFYPDYGKIAKALLAPLARKQSFDKTTQTINAEQGQIVFYSSHDPGKFLLSELAEAVVYESLNVSPSVIQKFKCRLRWPHITDCPLVLL